MKRVISIILVVIMSISVFGLSAHAELDLSSWEAFKAQAAGQATPTPAPTPSLAERLNELVEQIEADNNRTDAVSSASGSAPSPTPDASYKGPTTDIFDVFKQQHNTDAVSSASLQGSYVPGPSENDLIAIGFDGQIKMPNAAYYLPNYEYAYIFDPSYGLNVCVFRNPDNGLSESNLLPKAWQGSEVTLLAKRHDYYCIIYYTNENQICAGWVHEDNLCSSFPGDWYGVGKRNSELYSGDYYMVRPEVEWADEFYIDSYTEYQRVWSPGKSIGVTLEYQVIGRNDKKAYGGREVYINLGDGWRYVGGFDVNEELDPVRYTMYFNYPIDIKAVAVLPTELSQQGFDFRMCLVDMFYVLE